MPVTIRAATREDLPRIHPVIERAYRGESARLGWTHEADIVAGPRTDLDTLGAIVDDSAQKLLIAEQDGEALGCVQVSDRGKGVAYLGLLCVEPTIQNGGVGKKLMEAAERVARDVFEARRIEMTVIDSRARLIDWYKRHGYASSGEARPFPVELDPPLTMTVLVKPFV